MDEAKVFDAEEEGVITLGDQQPATEEAYSSVVYKVEGEEKEDDSDSAIRPLLGYKHQDSSDRNRKASAQTVTDGNDRKASVPRELELAGGDQPGCSGSVRSSCSDSSQRECPICSELFDSHGDRRVTLLNCNHKMCHRCTAAIMSRAKDTSRIQCPFCRQSTPFPEWEIWRLQEESYSSYELGPSLSIGPGPELQAVPASPLCCFTLERHTCRSICACCIYPSCLVGVIRARYFVCFVLVLLLMLGCFLYLVGLLKMLFIHFSDG